MKVVITGTSKGIGRALALKFLHEGHVVHGLDLLEESIGQGYHGFGTYIHHVCDVSDANSLPDIYDVDILINNAGVQNSSDDISTNLWGVINCTEKYGMWPGIKSILNQASVSAHNGAEFPIYAASKGGVLSYTRAIAKAIAPWGATCNSVSFGGVMTELNKPVMENEEAWEKIMDMTPLKKWATPEEAAEWMYFIAAVNTSMTAQDIIIDNGEMMNHKFVWC